MELRKVGILDFARSPISKTKNGALNKLSGLEIAAQVVKALIARNPKLPTDKIEMLVAGCAFPEAENGLNLGRNLAIKAGLPKPAYVLPDETKAQAMAMAMGKPMVHLAPRAKAARVFAGMARDMVVDRGESASARSLFGMILGGRK